MLTFSTSKPDNCACDKFVTTAAKNEAPYLEATVFGIIISWHIILALMGDQEFSPTGYGLKTIRLFLLKPDIANAIGI